MNKSRELARALFNLGMVSESGDKPLVNQPRIERLLEPAVWYPVDSPMNVFASAIRERASNLLRPASGLIALMSLSNGFVISAFAIECKSINRH